MKKILIILAILGVLNFFTLDVYPREFNIAYVDVLELFNEYEKTKDYDTSLEKARKKKETELNKKKAEIEKLQSKLSVLNESEQTTQKAEIEEKISEIRQLDREASIDLRKQRNEMMKEIIEDINEVVEDYAKNKKFNLVVKGDAALYVDKSLDITKQILKEMNKKYKSRR